MGTISKNRELMIIKEQKLNLKVIEAVIYCFMFLVLLIVTQALLAAILSPIPYFRTMQGTLIISALVRVVAILASILIITKNEVYKLSLSFKGNSNVKWLIATILFSFGFRIITTEIFKILIHIFPPSKDLLAGLTGDISNIFLKLCIYVVIVPILEELFFRVTIAYGLKNTYNKKIAIFISALLFGLLHLNIYQFVVGTIMGIFLAYIYLETQSLILPIVAHVISNGYSYLLYLLNIKIPNNAPTEVFQLQAWWWNLTGIILIAVSFFIFKKLKQSPIKSVEM